MVYITGDCHGNWRRFSSDIFPEQKEMTRNDYVIVCGDFGIWHDTPDERWWLDWLAEKPFTVLFVDGNHENFDRLCGGKDYPPEFETVDFLGGKAQKIRQNIYRLMRGYVFTIEGKKFFAFGGARSHDIKDGILDREDFKTNKEFLDTVRAWNKAEKWFRINHVSWWKQEMPTKRERDFGDQTLEENGYKVDFIVSHCAPASVASHFGYRETDVLTKWFNDVANDTQFRYWFFGHYHHDNSFGKYVMLYEQIIRVL